MLLPFLQPELHASILNVKYYDVMCNIISVGIKLRVHI